MYLKAASPSEVVREQSIRLKGEEKASLGKKINKSLIELSGMEKHPQMLL